MKKFDKFVEKIFDELSIIPLRKEKLPNCDRFEECVKFYIASHYKYEPVLQIRYCCKSFYCRFYVLNRKICGYCGITPDDPLVQLFCREGSWSSSFSEHIISTVKWVELQQENHSIIPESRRIDHVSEILAAFSIRIAMAG